jgi:ADP-L-glycero-D-manno-heptose 6-epimerase
MGTDKLYVVTGGAGFIGSNIAAALAAEGKRVVVVDRLGEGDKWKNLAPIVLHDIVRPDAFMAWLHSRGSDDVAAIVHMGAISSTTERDGDRLVSENVRFSLDLWDWCAEHQVPFVYASSAATYGDGMEGFDDDGSLEALARLKPMNGYGWSKHMVDRRIAMDVAKGRKAPPVWAGLKFFNVYGPGEASKGDMRSVALKLYETLSAGGRATLFRSHNDQYADGGQLRDFVYVADCAAVVLWMLEQDRFSGLYNLGTGKARSFLDLAKAVFEAMELKPEITYVDMPEAIRDRYQYFTEAKMDRLRQAGYGAPFASVEEGVADYVAWLKTQA